VTESLRAVVGLDSDVDAGALAELLGPQDSIELVRPAADLAETWEALDDEGPDLLIVACAGDGERALSFVSAAVKRRPQLPIVAVYQGAPDGFVAAAFEAGADEVLVQSSPPEDGTLPSEGEVLFTLQKAIARRNGTGFNGAGRHSRMICVLGPKGGIGKTVVASNLGATLASQGASVALVDLNLQFGDLALTLDLAPDRTIHDLATSGGALDAEKLHAFLTPHESGAQVLMAPTRPDQAGSITPEFLHRVYALLRSMHEYVVIDTAPGFTPEVIASTDRSTDVCMVAALDVLSLKSARVGLETLAMLGHDPARIRLVLNRADSRVGLSAEAVTAALGREPDVLVPSHRDVTRSVNEAKPIATASPRSEIGRAFKELAALYQPAEAPRRNGASPGRRRRPFRRA
jgi:pilus assembly protein CpaE